MDLNSEAASRLLQQDGEEVPLSVDNTQPLRIAAVFVILAAGLLGGIPPLFLRLFRDPDSWLTRLTRAFSAGVILALALVHITPEAVTEMVDLGGVEYPVGGVCVVFGILVMILLDNTAHIIYKTDGHNHSHSHQPAPACQLDQAESGKGCVLDSEPGPESHLHMDDHSHVCVSRGSAPNWAATTAEPKGSLRLKILAYMFELGCIFHSFIIGLSLGVNQTNLKEVRALLIALSFHQWLEGISLASVINRGGFPQWKGVLMVLTYSLTCPVGTAIGLGVAETYDGETITARAVQGAFNGVSGGMLLYISLVQLVAEDLGRTTPGRSSTSIRLASYVALCAGVGAMCLLAVWA